MNIFRWHTLKVLFVSLVITMAALALEKQKDGVLFELTKHRTSDPQWLKIQICSKDIIRVIASPNKSFSSRPSLMVDKKSWDPAKWTVKENGEWTEISTSKVTVRVNSKSGEVSFYNAQGKVLLHEIDGGGKIITPAEVMEEKTFHIQQVFDSREDEAFYGLGGHQNSIMNYKGHDVDLWQHNMVEVVPFLVSSKNYGILWDNTSHSKFGDIREYQSLSTLKLYSKDSIEGNLTAEYFKDPKFTSLFTSRKESRIEHEFTDVNDEFPHGFENNVSAVRWSGEIESKETGVHKFKLYSSGYVKLWLNGKLLVDSWRQNWNPWNHYPQLEMKAGTRYQIKLEWIHCGGYIGLKCLTPESDATKNKCSLYSEVADQIDYYFVYGDKLDQVISGYRTITGKAPMMPKWAMGFWQSREHYNSQDDILSTVKEFRKRQIPLDNIVQDWFYWKEDQWGSHEFDSDSISRSEGDDPDTSQRSSHSTDDLCMAKILCWNKELRFIQ